ncbi:unnamed protein product [Brachionus calyciflorus]|uniref:Cytochrome b5 reductase 4 n=1 Tax=Brachionus calyciflorus TaxID=104777 RepID=A0A813M7J0_9BILA|nr:unnamed protein product [Brachionus calyciflorus]
MLRTRSGRCVKQNSDFNQKILKRNEQKILVDKIKKILDKNESERSEDDKIFLDNFQDLVNNINQNKQNRLTAQAHQEIVIDDEETLKQKCHQLAKALKNSKQCIVYTGAGISTAASIPDYRGPNGLWTMLEKGVKIDMPDFSSVEPTFSHMALFELLKNGMVSHIVSQNCDGLHLRSGIDRLKLSELHGNCLVEKCPQCHKEYLRLFDVTEKTAFRKHTTGRFCKSCPDTQLVDSIIHFGEKLRNGSPYNWEEARECLNNVDLIICLGTSLKVLNHYKFLWPKKKTVDLYIVNIQWTQKDKKAKLKINGYCDQVLKMVIDYLNEEISCQINVPIYDIKKDPLLNLGIKLEQNELETTHKLTLLDRIEKIDSKMLGCYPDKLKGSVVDPTDPKQQTNNTSLNISLNKSQLKEKPKDLSKILDETQLSTTSNKNQHQQNTSKTFQNNSTGDTSINNTSKIDLNQSANKNKTKKSEMNISNSLKINNKSLLAVEETNRENDGGSASNDRKKYALGRGYSLMDWIRFTKESTDLAGNKGILRPVTYEELAKHDKVDDCWMAIYDKVYNVTPYMKYHPGGVEELMKGAGKNATALFNQVHQWVNIQSMLEKCLIGGLVGHPPVPASTPPKDKIQLKPPELPPPPPSKIEIKKDTLEIPVLDSYQSNQSCNIVLYTKCKNLKSDCLIIDKSNDPENPNFLNIYLYINNAFYKYSLEIPAPIKEDYDVKISKEGKIEIVLFKIEQIHWWQMCPKLKFSAEVVKDTKTGVNFRECTLKSRERLTHDTSLYTFSLPNSSRMRVPIGYHVFLRFMNNKILVKPYTVVSDSLFQNKIFDNGKQVCLIIKHYENGSFTSELLKMPIGSKLEISNYTGSFKSEVLYDCSDLYLICAGSGFTPTARILTKSLNTENIHSIKMLFFNKTEKDIILNNDLNEISKKYSKFKLHNILSDADSSWKGKTGRIREELLDELIGKKLKNPYFCICGPKPFTELASELLQKQGYSTDSIFMFLG